MSHAIRLHLSAGLCRPCVLLCIVAADSEWRCQSDGLTLACAWKRWTTLPASAPLLSDFVLCPSVTNGFHHDTSQMFLRLKVDVYYLGAERSLNRRQAREAIFLQASPPPVCVSVMRGEV